MVFDLIEDVRFGSLIAAVSLMLFPVALLESIHRSPSG